MTTIKHPMQTTDAIPRCIKCGDRLFERSADRLVERLRELLAKIPPLELFRPDETHEQWQDRHRHGDHDQIVHARVTLALIVDDADGYCSMCSPRYAALCAHARAQ